MTDARQSRISFLRDKLQVAESSRDRETYRLPFRGSKQSFTIIRMGIDFPSYNIQSGRTISAQKGYLDRHSDLLSDFFEDPEDKAVQDAQHLILLEMIDEMGLAEDIRRQGQREPIVLTYDGYVVNGNRRLAALREDGEEYVEAVVLSEDATSSEIFETELELQMALETKADYHWVDEALYIKHGIEDLNQTPKTIARRMRIDEDEVKQKIASLEYVDMFLQWLGEPGKYHKVPHGKPGGAMEQAFKDMTEQLSRPGVTRRPLEEQQAIREACYSVIKDQGGYADVRRILKFAKSRPKALVERARERIPEDVITHQEDPTIEEVKREIGPTEEVADELIADLAEAEAQPSPDQAVTDLQSIVGEIQKGRLSGQTIIDAAADLDAEEKEAKQIVLPQKRLERVLSELQSLELKSNIDKLTEVARLLDEIITETERLMSDIEELRSDE